MRMGECDPHRQRALGAAEIGEGREALPRETGRKQGDFTGGDARHSGKERLQRDGVAVEDIEELVLVVLFDSRGNTRPQEIVQAGPQVVEPRAREFHQAADVGRLLAVEERRCPKGVRIPARLVAPKQPRGDQCVECGGCGPRVPPQSLGQLPRRHRPLRQKGEHTSFDGGHDQPGRPERHPALHDVLRVDKPAQQRGDHRVLKGAHHPTLAPDID